MAPPLQTRVNVNSCSGDKQDAGKVKSGDEVVSTTKPGDDHCYVQNTCLRYIVRCGGGDVKRKRAVHAC